jgi:hypothetical protein
MCPASCFLDRRWVSAYHLNAGLGTMRDFVFGRLLFGPALSRGLFNHKAVKALLTATAVELTIPRAFGHC